MDPTHCHSNHYNVRTSFKVLPNDRVTKLFIVCPHGEIHFFVTFCNFTNTINNNQQDPHKPS